MKRKILYLNIIKLFCLFISLYQETLEDFEYYTDITNYVQEQCKSYGENNRVRQFSDCHTKSNLTNMQVCCYLTGVNADKSQYIGCIAVNSTLFMNKSIEYSSTGISGSLICTDEYSFMSYINISYFNLFLFIIILFLL